MDVHYFIGVIAIGIGATLLTDIWNLFLKRAFSIRSLNFCLLGRWLLHMPEGTFRHKNIAASSEKSFECAVGWLAHYTIGMILTLAFIDLASLDWLTQPILLPALLYGIGTVVFPLFVMQPSLGLGIASSNTSNPTQARLKSFMTHTVFGIGLWINALAVSSLLHVLP